MVSAQRASDLITGLLDSGYEQATRQVLDAIAASLRSGRVGRRLDELDAEAARLALAGERLTPDNPVVVALLNDLEPALARAAARTDVGAVAAQEAGADAAGVIQRGLALGDVDVGVLARLGINWNVPDPEAIAALTDYTSMTAWEEQIGALPLDVLDTVRNQIVRGVVQGWGPERVARAVRRVATGLAPHKANNLMRTVQLESYRTATAAHQRANADIAQRQIRIEVLDQRTCLACIALHGSEMPVGAKVEDHHQGRGTSILEVRGRPLNIQTGPEWFEGLSDEQKEGMAAFRRSPGKLEAIRSGRATLADFVQPYQDAVFGDMIREGSLDFARGGGGPGVPGPVPTGGGPLGKSGQGQVWDEATNGDERYFEAAESGQWGDMLQRSQAWADNLYERLAVAVDNYTGGGYRTINRVVRGENTGEMYDFHQEIAADFAEALQTAPRTTATTWRGIRTELTEEDWLRRVGTEIEWDAYSSASLNPELARTFAGRGGVVFEIVSNRGRHIEQGSRYRTDDIENPNPVVGQSESEFEVVFTPDSRFRVMQVIQRPIRVERFNRSSDSIVVILEDITDE